MYEREFGLLFQQPAQSLQRLLAAEDKQKRDLARHAASRHSRFGTTLTVQLNPSKKIQGPRDDAEPTSAEPQGSASSRPLVLHRQGAISKESGDILDIAKRGKGKKPNKIDELAREDNLSTEAKMVLQGFAREFVEACFNRAYTLLLLLIVLFMMFRSISRLPTSGHQIREAENNRKGSSPLVIHHQVVPRVLPHIQVERERGRYPAEMEPWLGGRSHRPKLDSMGPETHAGGYGRKGMESLTSRTRFSS